jgi:hypothetical protein
MSITDLEGREITVTDLHAAIKQAKIFKCMAYVEQTPAAIAATKERQNYWTDFYQKLLQLRSRSNH